MRLDAEELRRGSRAAPSGSSWPRWPRCWPPRTAVSYPVTTGGVPSLLLSRRDLDFLLYEWLDVEPLTKRDAVRRALARDLRRRARPVRADRDRALRAAQQDWPTPHEPTFDGERVTHDPRGRRGAATSSPSTGLIGAAMDDEVGGMQLPAASSRRRASPGSRPRTSAPRPTRSSPSANANLLLAHGTPEQIETYVRPMLEGRFFGTMCLSEPQAGSSLADITTRAEPQDDGTYRLFGNKMWISGGEHELSENIVHLVLAKIPGGPAGVKGISLFVVPQVPGRADGRSASATTSCSPGSTTRWATAAPSTRCSTSARACTGRAASRARSATWSASRTAAWPTCST